MSRREAFDGDLRTFAHDLNKGRARAKPGCTLEISTFTWNNLEPAERFLITSALERHGVRYDIVSQVGTALWICPDEPPKGPGT
jgi:hypothetical protein